MGTGGAYGQLTFAAYREPLSGWPRSYGPQPPAAPDREGNYRHARNSQCPGLGREPYRQPRCLVHGPYCDDDGACVAALAAEVVRYLNHATPRGGATDPAAVARITAELTAATYRLPQLRTALGE